MKDKTGKKEMSFEDSLKRLEEIISEMEGGNLPLDARLKRLEEGMRLSKFCSEKLDEAERKVEMLVKKGDGSFEARQFSPAGDDRSDDEASEQRPGPIAPSLEEESSEEDALF